MSPSSDPESGSGPDGARPRAFDVPEPFGDPEGAEFTVLPVPYERTTSYGEGTAHGPEAILRASHQVELREERTGREPFRRGIATLDPLETESADLGSALAEIEREAGRILDRDTFLVALGGEHAITAPLARACRSVHGEIGVVQLDAHADLRDSYGGTVHSHACVIRRLVDDGFATLGVGIRAFSGEEARIISRLALPTIYGWELPARAEFRRHLAGLPDRVYLSVDVDYFDPSLMPATGTPVPGGGQWNETIELVDELFTAKSVVAMDVVELAPRKGFHACDFLVAQLVYHCLARQCGP